MSVENNKVCCNCRHNIRTRTSEVSNIECHCEIDGDYIGYVTCMTYWCRHWSKKKEKEDVVEGVENET